MQWWWLSLATSERFFIQKHQSWQQWYELPALFFQNKDFPVLNIYHHIIYADSVLGSSLQIRNGATIISKCLGSLPLAPPTYLVCLDSLKGDSHPYKYLLAQTVEQRWQKYFSASLVVSSSFLGDFHSDELCLHGPESRIEVHGVWNRQSSFFHGKNVKEVSSHASLLSYFPSSFWDFGLLSISNRLFKFSPKWRTKTQNL